MSAGRDLGAGDGGDGAGAGMRDGASSSPLLCAVRDQLPDDFYVVRLDDNTTPSPRSCVTGCIDPKSSLVVGRNTDARCNV